MTILRVEVPIQVDRMAVGKLSMTADEFMNDEDYSRRNREDVEWFDSSFSASCIAFSLQAITFSHRIFARSAFPFPRYDRCCLSQALVLTC